MLQKLNSLFDTFRKKEDPSKIPWVYVDIDNDFDFWNTAFIQVHPEYPVYGGLVVQYGKVRMDEIDGSLKISFVYNLVRNPKDLPDDTKLRDFLGILLKQIMMEPDGQTVNYSHRTSE